MLLVSGLLAWLVVKDCPAGPRNMVTLAASELFFPLRVDREIYLAKNTYIYEISGFGHKH